MFKNHLNNLEKNALLVTLAHLSSKTSITTNTTFNSEGLHKNINIQIPSLNIDYNIDHLSQDSCDEQLITMLKILIDEYNCDKLDLYGNQCILDGFASISNKIASIIKDELSSSITPISSLGNRLLLRLQNISDNYTLALLLRTNFSKEERNLIVLTRHLLDNIINLFLFDDGTDLMDFINGTYYITDLLCMNATLYDENTYFTYYQTAN